MVYNRKRHLELLERENDYKKLGKSFLEEEEENWLEFVYYQGFIFRYITWQNRVEFISLIEDFLNKTITGEEFFDKFNLFDIKLNQLNREMVQELHLEKFEDLDLDFLRWWLTKFNDVIENLREKFDNADDYELNPNYLDDLVNFTDLRSELCNDGYSFYDIDSTDVISEFGNGGHSYESKKFYQDVKEFLFKVQEVFEKIKQE